MDIEVITKEEAQNILNVRKVDNSSVSNFETILNADTSLRPLIKMDKLPSGFKGYPIGTTISYEPITLGELEAINNGDSIDIERGIAMLLKSIHCNTLPSEELYYWDVMYIGIQRKILAFGDTVGLAYGICPKCGSIVSKEFDYTELEFKELQVPDLPVITNISDKQVEVNLLSMRDFLELSEDKTDLDIYAKMIKNMSDTEALELVKNASGKDAKVLRYIDKILNYGLKPFKVPCNGVIVKKEKSKKVEENCKEVIDVEVRSPFEVVFPENEDSQYLDFEIQFGRE